MYKMTIQTNGYRKKLFLGATLNQITSQTQHDILSRMVQIMEQQENKMNYLVKIANGIKKQLSNN